MGIFQKKCGSCDWCREGREKCKAGTWYVDYYVSGRRRRETVPNKAMAEDLLSKRKVQMKETSISTSRSTAVLLFGSFQRNILSAARSAIKNHGR